MKQVMMLTRFNGFDQSSSNHEKIFNKLIKRELHVVQYTIQIANLISFFSTFVAQIPIKIVVQEKVE